MLISDTDRKHIESKYHGKDFDSFNRFVHHGYDFDVSTGLSDEEIREYVSSGECSDKAGAYAIQGRACVFIEKIVGDYFNVVGLPLSRLNQMLNIAKE